MKIAITYICTGKYERFWDSFFSSCEKYFYPDVKKHYFVFTESKRIMEQRQENVTCIYQSRVGWPYDTLLRFHWFAMVQDKLQEYDYCYFCNANSIFLETVTPEIIPFPTAEKPLILWCHTAHYDDYNSNDITTESNPLSTAYVGPNVSCRQHGGGFYGGTASAFLQMTLDLRDNIQKDLDHGIIATWHDQSHIIKYGSEHAHFEVDKDRICQEERNPIEGKCVMMFLAKENNGGIDNLRENGWGPRVRHAVIKVYRVILNGAQAVGLGKVLEKLVKILFPNRKKWYL